MFRRFRSVIWTGSLGDIGPPRCPRRGSVTVADAAEVVEYFGAVDDRIEPGAGRADRQTRDGPREGLRSPKTRG